MRAIDPFGLSWKTKHATEFVERNHGASIKGCKSITKIEGILGVAIKITARGQTRRSDTVDHCTIAQHRQIEARTVEGDQPRPELRDLIHEALDQVLFGPFADVRGTDGVHLPNVSRTGRNERADANNLVKDKLREFVPHAVAHFSFGLAVKISDRGKRLQIGDCFDVPGNDVFLQHQRGNKIYSLHAPEVECIGKGKAHKPYEFGVKVSVATTLSHAKGGQFVTHVKAVPGKPYDGHTLATVIPEMEALIGNTIQRLIADKGYRGHNAPPDYKFRVFIAGQKRRMTPKIKREMRRRSAIEPVIGHLKAEHRMERNYLAHRAGDAINAVLAAAGYNFRLLIRWLRFLLRQILTTLAADDQLVTG